MMKMQRVTNKIHHNKKKQQNYTQNWNERVAEINCNWLDYFQMENRKQWNETKKKYIWIDLVFSAGIFFIIRRKIFANT